MFASIDKYPKLVKTVIDVVALVSCLTFALIPPSAPRTGFDCGDMSIRRPVRPSSLNTTNVYIWGYLMPIFTMFAVEMVAFTARRQRSTSRMLKYEFLWILWNEVLVFLFGIIGCQSLTNIAKGTFAKHRPNFFAICRPVNFTCDPVLNYTDDYVCLNGNAAQNEDVRSSFFSGHSAFAFFVAVHTILFLQHKCRWHAVSLYVPLAHISLISSASYIALTRVADNRHHGVDVIIGSLVGAMIAFFLNFGYRLRLIHSITSPAAQ